VVDIYVEEKLDPKNLNGIYRDFANYLGMEMAIKIHQHYKGLQISLLAGFRTILTNISFVTHCMEHNLL